MHNIIWQSIPRVNDFECEKYTRTNIMLFLLVKRIFANRILYDFSVA